MRNELMKSIEHNDTLEMMYLAKDGKSVSEESESSRSVRCRSEPIVICEDLDVLLRLITC